MGVSKNYGTRFGQCGMMYPPNRHSNSVYPPRTAHQWRGYHFEVGLAAGDGFRQLEIAPLGEDIPHRLSSSGLEALRLRRAADIALEYDATLSRLVENGGAVRLNVKPPRQRIARRLQTVDDVIASRPSVEELVAPLIFDPSGQNPLRPFQDFGVQWLSEHRTGILADDMGLGKTAQALRALEMLIDSGTIRGALVVCPKSLLANWEAECERWVPRLTVVRSVPIREEANEVWSAILGRSHIIITSYEQLRPLPSPLASESIELVIADEAHRLRRSQAKLVKSFRLMNADRMWALTGTPIERHPVDLATLLSLLEPTRFSAKSDAIDAGLRALAQPYMLRRLKSDVLRELPEVIDTTETIELTPRQRRAYTTVRSQPLPREAGEALHRLTILRSICDVESEGGASAKLDRIVEILQVVQDAGEKAVVFSYLLRPLEMLLARMAQERPPLGAETLTGKLEVAERTHVVQRFKSDDSVVALLCSSRVGGEGLTLTEANHVIFINEWWNPSANAQARDRVVRLGQERVVHVHRFRCKETIEEVLDQILARKSESFANIVDALATGAQLNVAESNEVLNEIIGEISTLTTKSQGYVAGE